MTSEVNETMVQIEPLLNALCPMHLVLGPDARVRHTGPALDKLVPDEGSFIGQSLFDIIDLRRPKAEPTMAALRGLAGRKLHLALRSYPQGEMKGVLVPLPETGTEADGGMVLNLSFGISIVDAVRDFALTGADFAVTDLAVEMLYLVEAQSAVMHELRRLNGKLDGARQAAEAQATTDQLTGLANRRAMDPALGKLTSAAAGFVLLHLDLDFFKEVNDKYGHAAGDHVLQIAAERLIQSTRAQDVVLRLGGDEFMVILSNLTATRRVRRVAERIIDSLEMPIPFGEETVEISASIGASLAAPGMAVDADALMREADTALYAAKAAGRRQFRAYSEKLGQIGVSTFTPPGG